MVVLFLEFTSRALSMQRTFVTPANVKHSSWSNKEISFFFPLEKRDGEWLTSIFSG